MPASENQPQWSQLGDFVEQRLRAQAEQTLATLGELLKSATQVVGCSEAGLLIPADDEDHLRFLVSVNSRPEAREILERELVPCAGSIAGYVFSSGQPIAYERPSAQDAAARPAPTTAAAKYERIDELTGIVTQVYIAVPVTHRDHVLGVQTFVNRPADQPSTRFTPEEMEAARRFAALSAVVLQFYRRAKIQLQLAEDDLRGVLRQFPSGQREVGQGAPFDELLSEENSPLARVLNQLEGMPQDDQRLYADLAEVLGQHLSLRLHDGS